jgi:hypothetical protein
LVLSESTQCAKSSKVAPSIFTEPVELAFSGGSFALDVWYGVAGKSAKKNFKEKSSNRRGNTYEEYPIFD